MDPSATETKREEIGEDICVDEDENSREGVRCRKRLPRSPKSGGDERCRRKWFRDFTHHRSPRRFNLARSSLATLPHAGTYGNTVLSSSIRSLLASSLLRVFNRQISNDR